MIIYKMDILASLKKAGYSTYVLREKKLLGQRTIQQLRESKIVSWADINKICNLLNCQPGDLVKHVSDESINSVDNQ